MASIEERLVSARTSSDPETILVGILADIADEMYNIGRKNVNYEDRAGRIGAWWSAVGSVDRAIKQLDGEV